MKVIKKSINIFIVKNRYIKKDYQYKSKNLNIFLYSDGKKYSHLEKYYQIKINKLL